MKKLLLIIFFAGSQLPTFCQHSLTLSEQNAISGTNKQLIRFFGEDQFQKNIVLDTLDVRAFQKTNGRKYWDKVSDSTKNIAYNILYFVTQSIDTVAYILFTADKNGNPVIGWQGLDVGSKPENFIGIKKLLDNKFQIDYRKALDFGHKRGLMVKPYLDCETVHEYKIVGNEYFVKTIYYWNFSEIKNRYTHIHILLDAETGKILLDEESQDMVGE